MRSEMAIKERIIRAFVAFEIVDSSSAISIAPDVSLPTFDTVIVPFEFSSVSWFGNTVSSGNNTIWFSSNISDTFVFLF